MLVPLPTQLSGAAFLADRDAALLADQPRVGKTGTAIMAADYRFARTILVVTTASGRSVWERAFAQWSNFGRSVQIALSKDKVDADVVIVGWPSISDAKLRTQLLRRHWNLLVLDESHYGKSFEAKRTQAAFGQVYEGRLIDSTALCSKTDAVWCLSGTPMPNSALDLYPMLRTLAPDRLSTPPDVTGFEAFKKRYCITKPVKIGHGYMARYVDVVIGGRNEPELADRLRGFMLLRTQADVGIREPVYETFPLAVSAANRRETEKGIDSVEVLRAAEAGDTKSLDMHLGPLRRLTGEIKARAVVDAVKDEFDCGLDKIVLAYWHRDVGDLLAEGLKEFGVVRVDGSTPSDSRAEIVDRFAESARVFLAQIEAAGEAIDLSAAAELMFVETVFSPKAMKQMSLRITNHQQARLPRVRVAVLAGSIDEALQDILLRKWSTIRKVLQ